MDINVRQVGDIQVLDCTGRLTMGSGDQQLKDTVKRLLDAGHHKFVLNLEQVPFMDSSGLGELVGTYKRVAERKGTIKLAVNPRGQELIALPKLHLVFDVFPSADAAIRSFTA